MEVENSRGNAAKKLILPDVEHRQSRYLNNRAENSHQPTRMRERQMKRFQSPEHAQRFLWVFKSINAPCACADISSPPSAAAQANVSPLETRSPSPLLL